METMGNIKNNLKSSDNSLRTNAAPPTQCAVFHPQMKGFSMTLKDFFHTEESNTAKQSEN